ncbi:M protein, serotype 6-like [Ambystoma mexicanum]|uniref:M protein, serotype 6-like n=1 Tax=Ambystoma mexicanum TaxID=8296 RepID=UPI0037E8B8C8
MSIVDTVTIESEARSRGVEESTQTQEIISEGDNIQSVSVSSSEEGNIESLLNLSTYSTQEPEKVRNEDKSGEGQQEQQPNPASMLTIDCYDETITESYISIELSCEEISDEELYTGNSTLNTTGKERIDQEQQSEETNKNRDKRADRRMKQPRNEERSKLEQLQFVDPYYKESVMRLKLEGRSKKEANILMNRTNLLHLFNAIPKLEKLKSKDLKQIEFRDDQRLDKIWIYCCSRELKSLISSCAEELEDRGFRVSNDDKTDNDTKETPRMTQQESNRTYSDISSDESNLHIENKGWSEIEEVRWYKDEKKKRNSIQYKDKTPNKWNFEKSPFWREISMEKSRNEETKKPRQ